jgi:hypothetical protein
MKKVLNDPTINSNELIKQTLKDVLYNSLAQSIIKIFQSPHVILKIFLFLFTLSATGLSSYLIVQSVLNFLSFEVITTSRTIFELPTIFPKITICNISPFTSKNSIKIIELANKHVAPNIDIFDEQELANLTGSQKFKLFDDLQTAAILIMNSDKYPIDRKSLGHTFEDILFDCIFNFEPCTHSQFKWTFDKMYGNCYEFNSKQSNVELKKSYFLGRLGGLKMSFYANFHQNLTVFNSFYNGIGALIRVENSTYSIDNYGGVKVSAGFQTDISIERSFKTIMPKPYSGCENENLDSTLYKMITSAEYRYAQPLCLVQCFQRTSIRECNCTSPWMLSLFNAAQCESLNEINCSTSILIEKCLNSNFIRENCLKDCPLECQVTEYKTSLSSVKLVGDYFINQIKQNENLSSDFSSPSLINARVSRESVVQVYVFYDTLSYGVSTESPKMDLFTLISNIGGTLGLFLGVSLFSLCEIVECLIEIYFIKRKLSTKVISM